MFICDVIKRALLHALGWRRDLSHILTPQHVLFLICLYISSRALSKVFEHKKFCRVLSTGNQSYLRKFRSLVTMDARLAYNIGRNIHIHNKLYYLLRQKMIYKHIAVLWHFLPDKFLYSLHHSNTFVLLFVSIVYLLTFENESKSVNILICCFISVLIKVHRGTQISYVLQFFHEHRI